MANRFWVGGTGNWDASTTTNWSDTSGGAGGFSVPTSADDVFFDASSGAGTVTVTATANCQNLNFTGFTQTFAGSSALSIYGNYTLSAGMTVSYSGNITFRATTSGKTITTNGKSFNTSLTFNGVGGSWTLTDNITLTGATIQFTITNGTVNTNNFNMTGLGAITTTATNGVLNAGTSTIGLQNNTCTINSTDTLSSATLNFTGSGGSGIIFGANTNVFSINIAPSNTTSANSVHTFTLPNGQVTVQNFRYYLANGTSFFGRLLFNTSSGSSEWVGDNFSVVANKDEQIRIIANSNHTFTINSSCTLSHIAAQNVTLSGAVPRPVLATNSYSLGGNVGIEFASYPANGNIIRPAMFSPGKAR